MANNTQLNQNTTSGDTIATLDVGGVKHELVVNEFSDGAGGVTKVSASTPLPVTDNATEVSVASIDLKTPSVGQAAMVASTPVVIASNQSAVAVSAASLPLPSGASTAALQTQPGVDIGDVTINNASGASAVNIQDGGNSITVDGTIAISAGSAVIGHVIADTGSTTAVTGNVTVIQGTASSLKTAATLDAETTKVIGTINIAASQTLATVTTVGAVTAITNALPAGTNLLGIVQSKEIPDATSTYSPSNATSTAYEASRVIKASAGVLYQITGYNSKTSSQFIQLHNTASVPSDTAVPVVIFIVPASANFSFEFPKFGRFFSTGITIVNSSTGPTKTIGSADCFFDVQFF